MFKIDEVFPSKETEQEIVEELTKKRMQSIRKEEVERDSRELNKILKSMKSILENEILYSITKVDYIPPKTKKALISIFPRGKHTYYKKGKNKNLLSLGIKITFEENVTSRYNTEIILDTKVTVIDNKSIRMGSVEKNVFDYLMETDDNIELIVEF